MINQNRQGEPEIVVYVGTHKLVALEGRLDGEEPRIVRHAVMNDAPGFEKGFVTSLDRASASLEKLLKSLRSDIDPSETSVSVVLGNSKLKSYSFSSAQYFQGMQKTVSVQDIRAVVEQTRSVAALPLSEFVLQALPESFLVNDLEGVKNPLGLEARRLGVYLKMLTMNFHDFKNIVRAFEGAEITVKGYYPKTLTAGAAVLTEQEKEEGALVIDVADEALSFILWKDGRLVGTRVLDKGARVLTAKIAEEWSIEPHDARRVKEQYGTLELDTAFSEELIPLVERSGKGNYQIRRQEFQQKFTEAAKVWMEGILAEARNFSQEERVFYPHYVFTGGGTAVNGFLEFLQANFSQAARIGLGRKMDGPTELFTNPALTGALGLYRWLHENTTERAFLEEQGFLQKTLASAKDWFSNYF